MSQPSLRTRFSAGCTRPCRKTRCRQVERWFTVRHEVVGLRAPHGLDHFGKRAGERIAGFGAETEILSALGNLVTNAIRYTPDGGTIHVDWRMRGGGAVFSVTDSGFGIPAVDIPRLTERFYRVDRSRSRDTGGTGLGLAIVKHVLQRHDAQLDVKSEEGRGSTFTVRFPPQRSMRHQATHA